MFIKKMVGEVEMVSRLKIDNFYYHQDQPKSLQELIFFLQDVADRQVHGVRDNNRWQDGVLVEDKREERLQKIRNGPGHLVTHCRYITQTLHDLLQEMDIPSRTVEFISGKGLPRDTRHSVCEVRWKDSYLHADVDMGVMYTSGSGVYANHHSGSSFLSSLETFTYLTEISPPLEIWRLTDNKKVDTATHAYLKEIIDDNSKLERWYKGLMGAMMIETEVLASQQVVSPADQGKIVSDIVDSKRAAAQFQSREDFQRKYYPTK